MGTPSETWGQKIVAIVVLCAGTGKFTIRMMRQALKEKLAPYKLPMEMKVVDAIPRNAMGKGMCVFVSVWIYICIYIYIFFIANHVCS